MTRTSGSFKRYVVKLKPRTPIHVWAGSDAVVGVDAFIVGNDFYYLRPELLDQLSASMLEDVVKRAEKDPKGAMRAFFNALLQRDAIASIAKVKVRAVTPEARVRLLHENIVPGSTLKGYIRTAIIRMLLKGMPTGIPELIRRGVNTSAKPAWASVGLEALLFRKPRTPRQGGFVDVLELLMVSDPEVVEKKLSLRELRVVHVCGLQNAIATQLAVTLDPTQHEALRYTVTVNTSPVELEKVDYRKLRREDAKDLEGAVKLKDDFAAKLADKAFLLEALREHGCKLVKIEREKLCRGLNDYAELLDDLSKLCKEGLQCVPARIGFMAGRESKTIIDLVHAYTPDVYNEVASIMSQQLGRDWDAKTLKLVDFDGKLVGVGWCELCMEE